MKKKKLSVGESELQDMVRVSEVPLAVLLGEPFHPGSRAMSERVRRAVLLNPPLKLIEIPFSTHRDWAEQYRVHGTPSLLLFAGGRETLRLLGTLEENETLELLRRAKGA